MAATTEIDARGLACPQPVLATRKALARPDVERVRVLVDNPAAKENVSRLAGGLGWDVTVAESDGGTFALLLKRPAAEAAATVAPPASSAALQASPAAAGAGQPVPAMQPAALAGGGGEPCVVWLFSSEHFGHGDDELGAILIRALLKTLGEIEPAPAALIFVNGGVRLTTHGSELLDDLRALEALGCEVLSCGTCLDYYGLEQALEVGRVSNMFEIASRLAQAERVVRP